MLPDFPAFPSVILDGGRARMYRVHGRISLVAVAVTAPVLGDVYLYAFCEHRKLGAHGWITRDVQDLRRKMEFFRAGLDPTARDRPEQPSADEAPDIRPLYERGYGYGVDDGAFRRGDGGVVVPIRP
jgi:hypothetical protein